MRRESAEAGGRATSPVEAEWERGVDVLVNNAGLGAYGPIERVPTADLEAVVATNLLGAIYCTKVFLPGMVGFGRGTVVFISSARGELPAPNHAVYGATKFALTGLAESLRSSSPTAASE